MSDAVASIAPNEASLDDKWDVACGRIVINGTQAIARVLLAQHGLDRRAGLNTAGYVTGYRGSPLGNVDTTLWSIGDRLESAGIRFHPAVNEDLAATAIRGTQQIETVPGALYDGVFAAWYGKGPGVDRSGDAFKHGNYAGSHRLGGVLVFFGDDHAGKSSTVAHQSEQALAASLIPSLYPSDVREIISYGLFGLALSRFSGCWVGVKCVNEVVEQTSTVDLDLERFQPIVPPAPASGPLNVNIQQGPLDPLGEEQRVLEHRLPRVHAFVRANHIDRVAIQAPQPALGLVTAGKTFGDVRAALALLGLDDAGAARAGISLYKIGCIWPLEPIGLTTFAAGHRALLVIEEKKSFLEQQAAAHLINLPDRPLLLGKVDEEGTSLLSTSLPLDPTVIALAIAGRLERLGLLGQALHAARDALLRPALENAVPTPKRTPYFCSGCPHNRSTQIPDGSISMTGIGCHTMASFVRPDLALLPTHMGGEGANWIGLAPFTDTAHIFQNMGDGTYYHSGLLAIRGAIAAKVNITYKILYNDAVAMTGGQPVDGPISVAQIARQLREEGVERIVILSDDPSRHQGDTALPEGVAVGHRDTLDEVQRGLRETPGCTVLIYEQTCAAEKRRRRKRGTYSDPPKRLFIATAVCEGCGDCSVQSTCVSLIPVETEFGRKRAIDQSSCNKDYSCLNGFCPSFITVHGAAPRKPEATRLDEDLFDALPTPVRAPLGAGFNLIITGIGGTGVVTVGALIGMAAHLEGKAVSSFDMTGLSQKNGAVFSHVKITAAPEDVHSQRVGRAEADLLLAFDLVAALAPEAAETISPCRTSIIANAEVSPTVAFQFDRDLATDADLLLARLGQAARRDAITAVNASSLALAILGDTIGANLFLVGVAAQHGLLPIGIEAIEGAVALNNVAVPFNLRAFRLGRLFVTDPGRVLAMAKTTGSSPPVVPRSLEETIAHRSAHLHIYQNEALVGRYQTLVTRVREAEARAVPGSTDLALAVARNYARLLAYKDEYEVARLLTERRLHAEISQTFADGGRIAFNLAPSFLAGRGVDGRPRKRAFGQWVLPILRALSRLRFLRGTWFDPFGHSAERQLERALITDYERLVDSVVEGLTTKNHDVAVQLLSLADTVRGYGPVKEAALVAYGRNVEQVEAAFSASAPREAPAGTFVPLPSG